MGLSEKSMLSCFTLVRCQEVCGLMVSAAGCNHKGPSSFLGGQNVHRL